MRYALSLFILALLTPPDPQLRARWDGPGAATIQWTQQARGCLYVNHTTGAQAFIGCYDGSGRVTVELGHQGPVSGDVRPQPHDIYVAQIDGITYRTPLQWYRYLPVFY